MCKHSQVAQFADRIVDELSTVGQSLVMPALNVKIKDFFGFDFGELLQDMRKKNQQKQKHIGNAKADRVPKKGSRTKKSAWSAIWWSETP